MCVSSSWDEIQSNYEVYTLLNALSRSLRVRQPEKGDLRFVGMLVSRIEPDRNDYVQPPHRVPSSLRLRQPYFYVEGSTSVHGKGESM